MSCRALEAVPEGRSFDRPTVRLLLRVRRALTIAIGLATNSES